MNANHRPTAANAQTKLENIDESFFDNHPGYLLSKELNQGGIDAIESFMHMCNHLEKVFNIKLKIRDISNQTVTDLVKYLIALPNISIPEINLQLMELEKFLEWTTSEGIPTQVLLFPTLEEADE